MIVTYLPSNIPLIDLAGFAMAKGYRLYSDKRGNITFKPADNTIGRQNMQRYRYQRFKGVPTR